MKLKAEQLNRQGIELSESGKLDKALLAFTTALEMEPANSEVIYNTALVFMKKKDWTAAVRLLHRVEQLEPEEMDYLVDLGLCHYEQQQYEQAELCYRRALEKNPMNKRGWNNLGVLHFIKEDYTEAAELFKTALSLDPDYADGWFNLRDTLLELKDTAGARKADRRWQELIK